MKAHFVIVVSLLGGCGGGGGGAGGSLPELPPVPIVVNEEPGGIWFGVRPNGTEIVVLVSEAGDIRILDLFGNQGYGTVRVSNGAEISASYRVVPEFGRTLIDGSDFADCTFAGTVSARQSMTVEISCLTSLGGQLGGGDVVLTYDPIYDTDSSIARIAGTYQNPEGDIMTIDINGALFLQNAQYGCVVNGRVSLLDTEWNLYGVDLETDNCQAEAAPLNGTRWSGLAAITVVDSADVVFGGITGEVNGLGASRIVAWLRI